MRKILTLTAAALMLACCTTNNTSNTTGNRCVRPLPAGYSADSLTDCTVPAQFTVADFDWTAGTLTMTVYSEDLYDAADISQLKAGDTIVYQGRNIVVAQVADMESGFKTINGGIEEGGAELQAGDGGTYRGTQLDDHSVYTTLGKATVPVAANLVVIDCGIEPTDPVDTIRTDARGYLQKLGQRDGFNELNTQVLIENGKVTQIARRWIP